MSGRPLGTGYGYGGGGYGETMACGWGDHWVWGDHGDRGIEETIRYGVCGVLSSEQSHPSLLVWINLKLTWRATKLSDCTVLVVATWIAVMPRPDTTGSRQVTSSAGQVSL